MLKYYEPRLDLSSSEQPIIMGIIVTLYGPVDGEILRAVTEELRSRFPYLYIKAAYGEGDLITVPNALPMTVRNTWEPIFLNAEESNYHLAAWKYEGKRLAFEISHSLTDGAGMLPYIKSALYLYLSRKTGKNFDSTGFRLPGDDIPTSETGNPFATLDIDSVEAPLYSKAATTDFYRLNAGAEESSRVTYIRLSEAQLMQYCKDFDGSPNTFFSVMFARAARRYDPTSEKTISIAVAIEAATTRPQPSCMATSVSRSRPMMSGSSETQ
jgi:hypothetical protein